MGGLTKVLPVLAASRVVGKKRVREMIRLNIREGDSIYTLCPGICRTCGALNEQRGPGEGVEKETDP